MLNFGGLVCSACGGGLRLRVAFDGMSENATRFTELDKSWGWVVSLECLECPRVYEICRTPDVRYISSDVNNLFDPYSPNT